MSTAAAPTERRPPLGGSRFCGREALDVFLEAMLPMNSGSNSVTLEARDASGNVATKSYSVNVTGDGASQTWDANGNLATKTEGADTWVYTWDAENRLKKVEKNSVEVASFKYDPLGRRVEKAEGGATTTFAYDAEDILRQVIGATSTKYIHGRGIDEPLASEDGTGTLSLLSADGLGSPVATTNAAGATASTARYDAWGNTESGTPSPYGFTGREPDQTGLTYYRARYYDSVRGRFISEDPIRWVGGINLYPYARNNAVNYIDPSGLLTVNQAACLGLTTVLGGLGGMAAGAAAAAPGGITIPFGMAAGGAMGATAGYAAGLSICRIPPPTVTCLPRVNPFPKPGGPPKRKCYFVGMKTEFGQIGCLYDCRPGLVFYQSDTGCPPILEF